MGSSILSSLFRPFTSASLSRPRPSDMAARNGCDSQCKWHKRCSELEDKIARVKARLVESEEKGGSAREEATRSRNDAAHLRSEAARLMEDLHASRKAESKAREIISDRQAKYDELNSQLIAAKTTTDQITDDVIQREMDNLFSSMQGWVLKVIKRCEFSEQALRINSAASVLTPPLDLIVGDNEIQIRISRLVDDFASHHKTRIVKIRTILAVLAIAFKAVYDGNHYFGTGSSAHVSYLNELAYTFGPGKSLLRLHFRSSDS